MAAPLQPPPQQQQPPHHPTFHQQGTYDVTTPDLEGTGVPVPLAHDHSHQAVGTPNRSPQPHQQQPPRLHQSRAHHRPQGYILPQGGNGSDLQMSHHHAMGLEVAGGYHGGGRAHHGANASFISLPPPMLPNMLPGGGSPSPLANPHLGGLPGYTPPPQLTALLTSQVLAMLENAQHGTLSLDEKIATVKRVLAEAEEEQRVSVRAQQEAFERVQQQMLAEQQMAHIRAELARTQQQQQLVSQVLQQHHHQQQMQLLSRQHQASSKQLIASADARPSSLPPEQHQPQAKRPRLDKASFLSHSPPSSSMASLLSDGRASFSSLDTSPLLNTLTSNETSPSASLCASPSNNPDRAIGPHLPASSYSRLFLENFFALGSLQTVCDYFTSGAVSRTALQQRINYMSSHLDEEDKSTLLDAFAKLSVDTIEPIVPLTTEAPLTVDTATSSPSASASASATNTPTPIHHGRTLPPIIFQAIDSQLSPLTAGPDEMDGVARWSIRMLPITDNSKKRRQSTDGGEGGVVAPTAPTSSPDAPPSARYPFHSLIQVNRAWERLTGGTQAMMIALPVTHRVYHFLRADFVRAVHRIRHFAQSHRLPEWKQYVVIISESGVAHYCLEHCTMAYHSSGVFRGSTCSLLPLPASQPVPPYNPDQCIDEDTILNGYQSMPAEGRLDWQAHLRCRWRERVPP